MKEQFIRTELIFGSDKMEKLFAAKVAVFGIGGVGGYAVEALARSGVGRLDLFDHDTVCSSNINRQIHALESTVGLYKVDVARERILDINPDAVVGAYKMFYLPGNSGDIDLSQYNYVVDAIDTVAGKIELAVNAWSSGTRIISSMGAGNKLRITDFEVADIFDTSVCPLAKVMRHELRQRGVERLKVVYSREPVIAPGEISDTCDDDNDASKRRQTPGSNAFVPAAVGLIIAGEVVRDLTNQKEGAYYET